MRVMVGQPTVVRFYVDDEDGELIPVDADTTVDVTVNDGTGILSTTGTAIADDANVGVYKYTLAPQINLDSLSINALATVNGVVRTITEVIQVVGTRLVPKWRLKQDPIVGQLNSVNLEFVLCSVEDLIRQVLGFPAVWEGIRMDFDEMRRGGNDSYNPVTGLPFGAPGGERLLVPGVAYPQQVYALTINGGVVDDDDLALIRPGNGVLVWEQMRTWPSGHYQMWLTHGMDVVPGDLIEAAYALCRYGARKMPRASRENNGYINERARQITTEGATILFAMPTPDQPTGLPEVDAVLSRYRDESVI